MKSKEERYDYARWYVDIFADELPKKDKETLFLGLLAQTDYKLHLKKNELINHAIIAGATGNGKSIAAQVIAEEALMKNIPVIVIDPTNQWTGFRDESDDAKMRELYVKFGMSNPRSFKTDIIMPETEFNISKNLAKGKITVFACRNKSSYIENAVNSVIESLSSEKKSNELKYLLVLEEFSRILVNVKNQEGFVLDLPDIMERLSANGIGVILVSQLLSDFNTNIRNSATTHIQMKTTYESDLKIIKPKYGENRKKSLIMAEVGTGLFYNPHFNNGYSVFVTFRPILHNTTTARFLN